MHYVHLEGINPMKLGIYALLSLLLISNLTYAQDRVEIKDLLGVYRVQPKKQVSHLEAGMTVEYKLAISPKKDVFGDNIVGLNEVYKQTLANGTQIELSKLKCEGVASLDLDSVLTVSVRCENNSSFEQKYTFSDASSLKEKKFEASVFSSLSGQEINMDIERVN